MMTSNVCLFLFMSNHPVMLHVLGINVSDKGSNFVEFKDELEFELEVLFFDERSLSVNNESIVPVLSPDDFRLNSP